MHMLAGAVGLVVRLAHTALDLDPMTWLVWIDHKQADQGVPLHIMRFLCACPQVHPNLCAVIVAPDRDAVRLPVWIDGGERAQDRSTKQIVVFFWNRQ